MAEGMMNPNGQDELMLVQSFEQLANAVGTEIPVSIQSEIAAVKAGNLMSSELQKILAEGSIKMMNQLNPETINSYQVDGQVVPMTQEQYGTEMQSGNITPDLPSADGETYGPSSGVSMDPNVMDMQQMIDAGIINPQRPPMRPSAAPMTSPPPQMRPKNLGGR